MSDEPEVVDGEVTDGPDPELAPAVDEKLPDVQLAVSDPADAHEVMVRMDDHDVALLLEEIQTKALRRWVYKLPGNKGEGLTVHAVQDIVQRMNWTGKTKIGLLLDANGVPVLDVETIEVDEGDGTEPVWVATAYAKDEVTGSVLPGASMEPHRMHKRDGSRPFDRFSRTKAIQKATRNALAAFIPEEIEQAVLAVALKQPDRVLRIQTEAEAKVADLPAPLTDERAKALVAECEALYDEIRELGGGRGKVDFTPGTFNAWLLQSQHDHDALERFKVYLEERKAKLTEHYAAGAAS
jgi:hypothetical protein